MGCGQGATTSLSGTVTIGGKPIPADAEATIGFIPEGKALADAVSAPINGGKYQVTEVPVGPNKVVFNIERPVGPARVSERTGQEYQEKRSIVPPGKAAGIETEIPAGGGQQDFDL
ncbi:hypothetical protein Pla123a_31650 [Posidoniimonas polymericola]|uniref:Carboxypeptidase regulatory-like domain-containing protein n=2 Tax=Posidoniimonas polymericola TaxID=2528002 RepID=A0A5C5YL47_9BACT|nr:hypothetical protein Pla123a_31650 [Posidoniimonas polymericola]